MIDNTILPRILYKLFGLAPTTNCNKNAHNKVGAPPMFTADVVDAIGASGTAAAGFCLTLSLKGTLIRLTVSI